MRIICFMHNSLRIIKDWIHVLVPRVMYLAILKPEKKAFFHYIAGGIVVRLLRLQAI
jgi:hypothetical protein